MRKTHWFIIINVLKDEREQTGKGTFLRTKRSGSIPAMPVIDCDLANCHLPGPLLIGYKSRIEVSSNIKADSYRLPGTYYVAGSLLDALLPSGSQTSEGIKLTWRALQNRLLGPPPAFLIQWVEWRPDHLHF